MAPTELVPTKREIIEQANEVVFINAQFDQIASFFSTDYSAHAGNKSHNGHAFIKRYLSQLHRALSNLRLARLEVLHESSNILTWQRTLRASHTGNLMGIPPSRKPIEWYELIVTRFEGNKLAEDWLASDLAAQLLLKQ